MPGSIVEPLLITDLPTFFRWRGLPPWGSPELEQLVDVCDRLVVDSSEWRDLPRAYAQLAQLFDRIAVSDIAWGADLALARRGSRRSGPRSKSAKRVSVTGPKADALLLAGWLRSRLGREVEAVASGRRTSSSGSRWTASRRAAAGAAAALDASDLLSAELDVFGRDPIYEAAVNAAR